MRVILSLAVLLLLSWPVQAAGGGYGVPQQQFIPKQQFAPAYAPQAQASFYKQQTIIQQQQFAPAYVPVQQAPVCAPAQAAFYAPVQAPVFRAPRQKGLFGGRNVFRQRTFFRGNAPGVQAQFSSY